MKRRIIALVLGLAVVGTLSTAALAAADDKQPGSHGNAHPSKTDRDEPAEGSDAGEPPPWAHGPGADAGWKDAWHQLSPAERGAKMRSLARQHATGMKAWAACAQKAGTDTSARARCERPLPPGLAKKQLAR